MPLQRKYKLICRLNSLHYLFTAEHQESLPEHLRSVKPSACGWVSAIRGTKQSSLTQAVHSADEYANYRVSAKLTHIPCLMFTSRTANILHPVSLSDNREECIAGV